MSRAASTRRPALLAVLALLSCTGTSNQQRAHEAPAAQASAGTSPVAPSPVAGTGPAYPDRVVSFQPGEFAGYGSEGFPHVVLGPPRGGGGRAGSLDVLSLGSGGSIVLEFQGVEIVDGPGADLVVFENPFESSQGLFVETGVVAVSEDGRVWHEFPCDARNAAGGFPGCAGVAPVLSNPTNGIPPASPGAGGDRFDLGTLGVRRARFVRIRDSLANEAEGTSGGFDLDAVLALHTVPTSTPAP